MATAKKTAVKKSAPVKKTAAKKTAVKKTAAKPVEPENTYDVHLQRDEHGVYLDDVNDVRAEIQRAHVEDRKPNLDQFPKAAVHFVESHF